MRAASEARGYAHSSKAHQSVVIVAVENEATTTRIGMSLRNVLPMFEMTYTRNLTKGPRATVTVDEARFLVFSTHIHRHIEQGDGQLKPPR
jgi:hypothetical protein